MYLLPYAKAVGQLIIFGFFYVFFGKPSLERFLEKQVVTLTTQRNDGSVMPPAITIVAYNGKNGGWKQNVSSTGTGYEALKAVCSNRKDLEACVKENTFGLEETVYAELGWDSNKRALTEGEWWREDFTIPWYGRSYTLAFPEPQGTVWRTNSIFLHMNKSDLHSRIFLHDPRYFLLSINPLALPINRQILDDELSGRFYFSLALTERVEYNTLDDPCVEDTSYNFTTCIKESLAAKAGCRLPWDTLSSQKRPICTTLDQYKIFSTVFETLRDAAMKGIKDMTGCSKPCTYKDYQVVNGPLLSDYDETHFHLSVELWMATALVKVETEVLLYKWTDLVADVGGTLGLFLGFSFMTLWDGAARLNQFVTVAKKHFVEHY